MGGIWGLGKAPWQASQTWYQGKGVPRAPGPPSRERMEEDGAEASTRAVRAGQALRRPSSPNPS